PYVLIIAGGAPLRVYRLLLSRLVRSVFHFFPCARHLCDLHSFPTRRSSDLGLHGPSRPSRPACGGGLATLSIADSVVTPPVRKADRKSTRLNSSHVSISYAVFCLKKKKQLQLHVRFSCDKCSYGRARSRRGA